MKKLSFAIVGGGPAAFYISKCLSKLPQAPILHIFEKEYCPFGLIRYGVAPDHISIKRSQTTLSSISQYSNFKYYGNQQITQPILKELRSQYSGVIYATGAQKDNQPSWFRKWKETSNNNQNVVNARDIVYWYNNHPKYEPYQLDLQDKRNVVIIGNGNVAIDITRIFLKDPKVLLNTQICDKALNTLRESKVKNVTIIGRRGFTHSAFALKQVREIANSSIKIYVIQQQLQASMNESSYIECTSISDPNAAVVRMNKRKVDFLKEKCQLVKKCQLSKIYENDQRKLIIRYLLDPIAIENGNSLKLGVTQLKGQPFKQKAQKTGIQQTVPFDLLVNSTGFKVQSIISSELDKDSNKIFNSHGCVLASHDQNKINLGQYTVGWCKSGPKGVIDETLLGSEETFNNIRIHINNKVINQKQIPTFATNSNINFEKYLQLKQIQLDRGDKEKFIKKKFTFNEIKQFFGK